MSPEKPWKVFRSETVIQSGGGAVGGASEGSPETYCVLISSAGLSKRTSSEGDSSLPACLHTCSALNDGSKWGGNRRLPRSHLFISCTDLNNQNKHNTLFIRTVLFSTLA